MKTKRVRWRKSLAVRLPKRAVEELRLTEGATLDIKVEKGAPLLRPAQPRYRLEDLLRGVTPRGMRSAWSWGPRRW
jgi:antitoxin MazE